VQPRPGKVSRAVDLGDQSPDRLRSLKGSSGTPSPLFSVRLRDTAGDIYPLDIEAVGDTGATRDVVQEAVLIRNGIPFSPDCPTRVVSATGAPLNIVGSVTLHVEWGALKRVSHSATVHMLVARDVTDDLLLSHGSMIALNMTDSDMTDPERSPATPATRA